ncbi:putative mitochondrial protein AtMg00310 [Silene latifolia]|uniref:putative mitochondrial protein AtMg00310 n=1 Tax=Silene latifolia TaxID=37657 RepID=UPI003D7753BD
MPVSVTNKINSLLAHFWWAGVKSGRSIHWCSKKFLSLPKREGGLGIRNIECLNQAMLAKHGWRILSDSGSYFAKVFRKKLLKEGAIMESLALNYGNNLSWGAKSILHGLTMVRHNIGWKSGLDSSLNVWVNNWVGGQCPEPHLSVLDAEFAELRNMTVKDLSMSTADGRRAWN